MKTQREKTFITLGVTFLLASFGFISNVLGYGSPVVQNNGGGIVVGVPGSVLNWSNYSAPAVHIGTVLGASTTASTTFVFTHNLYLGLRNEEVLQLQELLIELGILRGSAHTGFFGPLTLAAVRTFQSEHHINSTGFVGPLTRNALNGN